MKKRVLALLLAGAMACSVFAGCGNSEKEDADKEENKEESEKEEDSQGEESEKKELTTVKVLAKNDFGSEIKTADWEKYPVSEVIIAELEEIGIKLEIECIDNGSFENVVNTRLAAGTDVPDLIAYAWVSGNDDAKCIEWGKNGLIYPINELLDQYDDDGSIKAFYDEYAPGVWERCATTDGDVYWFSYLANAAHVIDKETGTPYETASMLGLSIRQDWVEAVGEEMQDVYTPEELFNVLKKMQDEDANGNGLKDEVLSIKIDNFENGIATGFGLSFSLLGGYYENDNKVFSNFYHENFPAYIEFMNSLYENGLYDSVRLSSTNEQMISENRVSGVWGYSADKFEESLPEVDESKIYYWPIIIDTDGDLSNGFPVRTDSTEAVGYCNYFVPTACEHPEAVTRLMDYVYTENYAVLDWLGLEGTGYEIDENGNYVRINANENFFVTSAGLYALPALNVLPLTASRYNESDPEYLQKKYEWQYEFSTEKYPLTETVEFSTRGLAMPTDEESAFISEKQEILSTYCQELLVDLILGNKSIDDLAEYQKEMDDLGMQEYLKIMQDRLDRALGK